jgi:acetyl-CoA C-acetyltransferase
MLTDDPIVIIGFARTPLGAFQGALASLTAPQLGSAAISAAVERSGVTADKINAAYMGCVLPAGLGQAPARQAAIGAGLPITTTCCTVNKVCGSGMQAVMFAHDVLACNANIEFIVAGGMESMSNAPYYLDKARGGHRMGHGVIYDHMLVDGLEDAYQRGKSMGVFADETASSLHISREEQDKFALRSLELAQKASRDGYFNAEITPVAVTIKNDTTQVIQDECPTKAKPEKIPQLKPAFTPNGTVTAANSSSISDGAAALVLTRLSTAKKYNLKPIAKILGQTSAAKEPHWFTTAPVDAIKKLFALTKLQDKDIDLYEINEAFAVVTLAAIKELNLDANKVNVHGGACALGHPIGASGARIICTLLGAMQQLDKKIGVASLCIGGGEATAIAIERMN